MQGLRWIVVGWLYYKYNNIILCTRKEFTLKENKNEFLASMFLFGKEVSMQSTYNAVRLKDCGPTK